MSLKKIVEAVLKNNSFLITSHTSPEGDALGSQLAFYKLVKKLKKRAIIVNEDRLPESYDFLPLKQKIKPYRADLRFNFDCFVVIDCSDLKRTGEVYRLNSRRRTTLNIDHHISNSRFADINWVEPESSSCSEMIYKLYKKMGVSFDREAALLLYTGIMTDTGSFHYSNTSALTHKAVCELMEFAIDVSAVYKKIYENISFSEMQFLAKILGGMQAAFKGKIVWFQVKRGLLRKSRSSFDLSERILSFGRAIKGVEVAALFKENLGEKNEVRLNLRSRGKADVNKIAAFFGGGGHKTASGATLKGKSADVSRKVLLRIEEELIRLG